MLAQNTLAEPFPALDGDVAANELFPADFFIPAAASPRATAEAAGTEAVVLSSDDEEAQLAKAIELSLRGNAAGSQSGDVDGDADLARAIQLSLNEVRGARV
jgi:DNA-binding NarL/FixJ family response regulator